MKASHIWRHNLKKLPKMSGVEYKHSPILKQAHSYALKLTHIFNTHHDRKSAMAKLDRWIAGIEKSDLTCFNTFIKTFK